MKKDLNPFLKHLCDAPRLYRSFVLSRPIRHFHLSFTFYSLDFYPVRQMDFKRRPLSGVVMRARVSSGRSRYISIVIFIICIICEHICRMGHIGTKSIKSKCCRWNLFTKNTVKKIEIKPFQVEPKLVGLGWIEPSWVRLEIGLGWIRIGWIWLCYIVHFFILFNNNWKYILGNRCLGWT